MVFRKDALSDPRFAGVGAGMPDRAILFIDGNNWYHSLVKLGLTDLGSLDYRKISEKLLGPRDWIGTRYYIGQVQQRGSELRQYLSGLEVRIDPGVFRHLMDLARRHESAEVMVEKAVDVMLAVDMVRMSECGEYDAAYPLSADGDYTPAVEAVQEGGKKVYAVSPAPGAQLAAVVDSFIRMDKAWFANCYA